MHKNFLKIAAVFFSAVLCLALAVSIADAEPVGKVLSISGSLDIGKKGGAKTVPAATGDVVELSDNLKTGAASSAVVMLNDGTKIYLGESAKARVSNYVFKGEDEKRKIDIKVFYGKVGIMTLNIIKIFGDGKKTWRDLSFTVLTPTAELNTDGAVFTVEVASNGTTVVGAASGLVSVKNIKSAVAGEYKIGENQSVIVKRNAVPTEPKDVAPETFDEFFGKTAQASEADDDGDDEAGAKTGAKAEEVVPVEDAPTAEDGAPIDAAAPAVETAPNKEAAPPADNHGTGESTGSDYK